VTREGEIMAKKRAKKATRRAGKAKASRARRRDRVPVDRATGQVLMFDPKTGQPTPGALSGPPRKLTTRQRAAMEEHEQSRRIWREEFRARRRARLATRKRVDVEHLPRELEAWLLSLESPRNAGEVLRWHDVRLDARVCEALEEWATECYLEGCRQGYIEGRVEQAAARRAVSDQRIRRWREQVVKVDGQELDRDDRDGLMYAEFLVLEQAHGSSVAERKLEQKHGVCDRRIRQIILEQKVLREYWVLVEQGVGQAAAADRVVQKHGVGKHGKPRHARIREIVAKARVRKPPEMP